MDVNEIITGLKKITGYPVAESLYSGHDKKYITFVFQDERPFECADNKVLSDKVNIYVHLYVPRNYKYTADKNKIRNYLEENDFLVESVTPALENYNGSVTQGDDYARRITFDCSIIIPRESEE